LTTQTIKSRRETLTASKKSALGILTKLTLLGFLPQESYDTVEWGNIKVELNRYPDGSAAINKNGRKAIFVWHYDNPKTHITHYIQVIIELKNKTSYYFPEKHLPSDLTDESAFQMPTWLPDLIRITHNTSGTNNFTLSFEGNVACSLTNLLTKYQ